MQKIHRIHIPGTSEDSIQINFFSFQGKKNIKIKSLKGPSGR